MTVRVVPIRVRPSRQDAPFCCRASVEMAFTRKLALPLLAALLVASAATGAYALGSSRNVKAHTAATWAAAVRLARN